MFLVFEKLLIFKIRKDFGDFLIIFVGMELIFEDVFLSFFE